jgi:hypothetical protein
MRSTFIAWEITFESKIYTSPSQVMIKLETHCILKTI